MADIRVEKFVNNVLSSNTYVVHDEAEAIVIDLGDVAPVAGYIRSNGLNLRAMFLTHTHYDHIYGIRGFMSEFTDVPIYTSDFGRQALAMPKWNFSRYHGDPISIESYLIRKLVDGDSLELFGGCLVSVMETPGHDRGCLSYTIGNRLFSGDSFIPGTRVIATFPNSDKKEAVMWYAKLEQMSAMMDTFPGHGCVILHNRGSSEG